MINKTSIADVRNSIKNDYDDDNWHRSNGGNAQEISNLDIINKSNVKYLDKAWYTMKKIKENGNLAVQTNPIVVGDKIFVSSADHHLLCLNAKTGKKFGK